MVSFSKTIASVLVQKQGVEESMRCKSKLQPKAPDQGIAFHEGTKTRKAKTEDKTFDRPSLPTAPTDFRERGRAGQGSSAG